MLVPLTEYAKRHGKNPAIARQAAGRGSFQTARKMGRDWFVDEDEPWPDRRVRRRTENAYIKKKKNKPAP